VHCRLHFANVNAEPFEHPCDFRRDHHQLPGDQGKAFTSFASAHPCNHSV
jgi:hypothetical protein